ncbi:hypothetical protein QE152_g39327 [Popillia japonica]|uniref:Uncharacterized protein n=1 Tax=Popillia japonica TaxID=7064 RepID=A0AAW1HU20_POPJA
MSSQDKTDVSRYKARLVIKACAQTIAVQEDMEIKQMDAVSAFFQGYLKKTIFMEQPENYVKVSKLKKIRNLLSVSNKAQIKKVKNLLKKEFKIKDMGEIKSCLGFRFTRDKINEKLQINQFHQREE